MFQNIIKLHRNWRPCSIALHKLFITVVPQIYFHIMYLFSLFSGKILTDDFADKEGLEMGDEYFANLDHIESVENFKEGYESEAHCSDSEGSGVDMSRIKIQPSAFVRTPKKGTFMSRGKRISLLKENKNRRTLRKKRWRKDVLLH